MNRGRLNNNSRRSSTADRGAGGGRGRADNGKKRGWFARHKILSVVFGVLVVALVAGGIYGANLYHAYKDPLSVLKHMQTTQPADTSTDEPDTDTPDVTDTTTPDDTTAVPTATDAPIPTIDQNAVNILVLGTDAELVRADKHLGARTDCIMIVSINVPNKTASIISIPRDTYVKIYNDKNKLTKSRNRINAAFGYGGGLASEDKAFLYAENTVNQFLAQGRIPIDGYVLFDMDFVSSLIDAVGGVDVPVNNLWHDTETFKTDVGIGTITLQNNTTMHMSGKQALAYARDRDHTRGGDQGRVKHQQDVIIALLKNLQSKGNVVKAIPDLFTQFQKDLYTSFNDLNQIAALAGIAQGMKMENVTQYVVTGQGFGVGGASMVVADQTNKAQIVQTVFGLANAADNSWTVGRLQGEINAQLNAGKAIVNTANSFLSNYAGYYSDDEVAALRAAIGEFNAAVSKNDTDAAADAQQDVQDAYNAISPTVTGRKQDVTDLASAISNVKSELNDKKGWMDSSQVSAVQSAIDAAQLHVQAKDYAGAKDAKTALQSAASSVFSGVTATDAPPPAAT